MMLGQQETIAAEQFRRFYAVLLGVRDAIKAPKVIVPVPAPVPAPAPVSGDGAAPAQPPSAAPMPGGHTESPVTRMPPPATGVDEVRALLTQTIADLGYRRTDTAATTVVDTGYVMAAVADEVLLTQCSGWAGHRAWTDSPLEAMLYGTRMAGDRIFAVADDLVNRRRDDPRVATAILLALLTGFRGRYFGVNGKAKVSEVKVKLYALMCDRPYKVEDSRPYAASDLIATTLEGESQRRLPALWPWFAALAILVAAYLPVSHLLWYAQVSEIRDLADQIIDSGATDSTR